MLIQEYKYADMSYNNNNLSMTDRENTGGGDAIRDLATAYQASIGGTYTGFIS
jgi:hypothetical protein